MLPSGKRSYGTDGTYLKLTCISCRLTSHFITTTTFTETASLEVGFRGHGYWLALTSPFDQHHEDALRSSTTLGRTRIVTLDAVLIEYLNALAEKGENIRQAAIRSVEAILTNPGVTVIPLSRMAFQKGFALYKARPDKGYSLTDCLSMTIMHAGPPHHARADDRSSLRAGGIHASDGRRGRG